MFRNIPIVRRLVGTMPAGGALVGITAFAIMYNTIVDGFVTAEQRELKAVYQNVVSRIDALGNEALAVSALIAGMPTVQQAMKT